MVYQKNKNIVRHTAHTIVSWSNPKQWFMIHTSALINHIEYTCNRLAKVSESCWKQRECYLKLLSSYHFINLLTRISHFVISCEEARILPISNKMQELLLVHHTEHLQHLCYWQTDCWLWLKSTATWLAYSYIIALMEYCQWHFLIILPETEMNAINNR